MPYYSDSKSDTGLLPYTGNDSPKPLYGRACPIRAQNHRHPHS
jgi:hypothetical protein